MDEVIIIFLLILLNGIFSMSEIAIISARKTTLSNKEKKGSKTARIALRLANDPDRFLSTVQIGITLIGILTGVYSGATLSGSLATVLSLAGISANMAHLIAQTSIVIIVTYLSIVFGELIPKRVGMNAAERTSMIIARPMMTLSKIAAPFVWLLSKSSETAVKLLGIKATGTKVTEEDIRSIVQEGKEDGEVQEVEQNIVERVFMLGDLKVNQLMTHRTDVVSLDINMSFEDVRKTFSKSIYEAYPVIDGSADKVVGVVLLKDLIIAQGQPRFSIKDVMRPATFIYENMDVYKTLEQMRKKCISQAFICDEFGCFQGIITLRDILEGLVGIIGENTGKSVIIKREDGKSWLVDGQCSFHEFLAYFDREDLFDKSMNYSTLAGMIIEQTKHIPQPGEQISWNGFCCEIVDMDGVRIDKVLITITDNKTTVK